MHFAHAINRSAALRRRLRSCRDRLRQCGRPGANERAAVARYAGAFILFVFFLVSSLWVVHESSRHIDETHVDERHVLWQGLKHLNPLGEPNARFQVGETTRWFMRLLYPGALYYVNSRLGGMKLEEDGAFHLGKYRESGDPHATGHRRNPIIQDFIFFMRVAFALLAIGGFCLALWALSRQVNPAAAAAYGALLLSGHTVVISGSNAFSALGDPLMPSRIQAFHPETTLFILFNLAAFLCLRPDPAAYRKIAYLGVLAAAALSTGLAGLVIAAPLPAYAAFAMRETPPLKWRLEVFLLFFAALMFLININAPSFIHAVNNSLWDIHQHQSPRGDHMETGDMAFFLRFMRDTGYFAIPLFLLALAWLAKAPRRRLIPVYVLGVGIAFTLWPFSNSVLYLPRNGAFLYVAMSFVIALAVGDLVGKTLARRPAVQAGATLGLLLVFATSAAVLAAGLQPLREAFFAENRTRIAACRSIGAVGLPAAELRDLRERATGAVTALPGLRGPFKSDPGDAPGYIVALLLNGVRPETALREKLQDMLRYDCLVAHRQGQTKQLTNFFAQQHYDLPSRVGKLFFFVKKQGG